MITFEALSSIDKFIFISWQSYHFGLRYSKVHIYLTLRYSKLHIWPWKVKFKTKIKADVNIWGLELNWYVCFSFLGNRTIFGWYMYIANSIFDLENSRSRSQRKSSKIYRSGPSILPEMKKSEKFLGSCYLVNKSLQWQHRLAVQELVQKHSHLRYPGDWAREKDIGLGKHDLENSDYGWYLKKTFVQPTASQIPRIIYIFFLTN